MQVQTQKQGVNQTGLACYQKVIINEQDFEPFQLIIHTTMLKMEDKEVILQYANGKQRTARCLN